MNREPKIKRNMMKMLKLLPLAILTAFLTIGLTACQTAKIKVLDPNTAVVKVPKAVPYTPPSDGFFVPESTMLRILNRLSDEDVFGKK